MAQQSSLPQGEVKPEAAQPQIIELKGQQAVAAALELLGQVAVLTPGKGFESIQLGESFAELEKHWGKPHDSKKTGLLRPRLHWAYRLDEHTIVEFIGKQTILRIHAHGKPQSVLRTDKNLSFQARPADVERVYGKARSNQPRHQLGYPQKGIDFQFSAQQTLQTIEVYSPDT